MPMTLLKTLTVLVIACALASCSAPPAQKPGTAPSELPIANKIPPKIGLALGGGAARGFAHIGVIAALEEAGIKVDAVAGTSAGSLVAAVYASGRTATQLQDIALRMEEAEITDWTLPVFGRGILRGEALSNYVNRQVNHTPIEQLSLPTAIVATDLKTGEAVVFQQGDTGRAVRASSAVPSVFSPVKIGEREFVDGGLVAPVPVRAARQLGSDVVIAVDISAAPEGNATDGSIGILLQTFAIMGKSINAYLLREADVVVRPDLVGVKSGDFSAKRRAIEAGRVAMQQQIPRLRSLIEAKTR